MTKSKTQMTKAELIDTLKKAEEKILFLETINKSLEEERVSMAAKLLDDDENNLVDVLKNKVKALEEELSNK
jgi:hypothetical protein|tara:strand:+ start:3230 stop:3445 length:216 start_codon:yes stop_codon:yes gene_type:complete